MSEDLFKQAKLKRRIVLRPYELDKSYNSKIMDILNKNYEGKCIPRVGYVKKHSIFIESKSIGKIDSSDFTGNVNFDIIFTCEITFPIKDTIFDCQVIQKNKIGLTAKPLSTMAYVEELPYIILLPKEIHDSDQNDLLDKVEIGDDITVKIVESSFVPEKIGKKCAHYLVLAKILPREAKIINRYFTIPDLTDQINELCINFSTVPSIKEQSSKWIKDLSIYTRLQSLKNQIEVLKEKADKIGTYIDIKNRNDIWRDLIRPSINTYELITPSKAYNLTSIVKTEKEIISRAYYKMQEILYKFPDLIEKKSKIISLNLGESPGGFIQALIQYRKKDESLISKNIDSFIGVSISGKETWKSRGKTTEFYLKQYGIKVLNEIKVFNGLKKIDENTVHLIGKTSTIPDDINGLGNLFHEGTLDLLLQAFKGDPQTGQEQKQLESHEDDLTQTVKADFITADGGQAFEEKGDDADKTEKDDKTEKGQDLTYEQEITHYRLIFAEIFYALNCQNVDGSFVLKIFDLITDTTVHFIAILKNYYKHVSLFKPYTSRPANSEKYVICKGFKGITTEELRLYHDLFIKFQENDGIKQFLSQVLILPDTAEIVQTIKEFNNTFMKHEADNIELGIHLGDIYLNLAKQFHDSTTDADKKKINDKFRELQLFYKKKQADSKKLREFTDKNQLTFHELKDEDLKIFIFR